MPNWNTATLYITGSKESIDELENTEFDFQRIRPMPKEIADDPKNLGGRCWNKDDDTGTLESWQTHCKTDKERATMKEHYEEHLVDFAKVCGWIDKYGVSGWHGWALKYWGTKWNPFDVDQDKNNVETWRMEDGKLRVTMTTAWSLPVEILDFVKEKYDVVISGNSINEDDNREVGVTI